MHTSNPLYDIYTKVILREIEKGNIPWFSNGTSTKTTNIEDVNTITGLPYHGINRLSLMMVRASNNLKSNKWISVEQAHLRGWSISYIGEGVPILYWRPYTHEKISNVFVGGVTKATWKEVTTQLPTSYYVYNLDHVNGVPKEQLTIPYRSNKEISLKCEKIILDFIDCPNIDHGYEKSAYASSVDMIGMPRWIEYSTDAKYYQALYHELIHSTGCVGRLDRKLTMGNTLKHLYSEEDMIADIGTMFLCSIVGIDIPEYIGNTMDYIDYWTPRIKANNMLLINIAYQAEAAVRYILNEVNIWGKRLKDYE